jgi:hypothetical protein
VTIDDGRSGRSSLEPAGGGRIAWSGAGAREREAEKKLGGGAELGPGCPGRVGQLGQKGFGLFNYLGPPARIKLQNF